jgi:hypothetical protein
MRRLTIALAVCLYSVALLAADGEDSAVYKRAAQLLRKKDFDAAEAALEEAREQYPDSLAVLSASAYCAEERKQPTEATRYYARLLRASVELDEPREDELRRIQHARKQLEDQDPALLAMLEMIRIGSRSRGRAELKPILQTLEAKVHARVRPTSVDRDPSAESGTPVEVIVVTAINTQIYLNGEPTIQRTGGQYDPRFARIEVQPGDVFTVKVRKHTDANWFFLQAKLPSGKVGFSTASGWYEYTPEEINAWWEIDKEHPEKYDIAKTDTVSAEDVKITGWRKDKALRNAYNAYKLKASEMDVVTVTRSFHGYGYLIYVVKEEDLR